MNARLRPFETAIRPYLHAIGEGGIDAFCRHERCESGSTRRTAVESCRDHHASSAANAAADAICRVRDARRAIAAATACFDTKVTGGIRR